VSCTSNGSTICVRESVIQDCGWGGGGGVTAMAESCVVIEKCRILKCVTGVALHLLRLYYGSIKALLRLSLKALLRLKCVTGVALHLLRLY
jgi:hypothetical protein